MLKFTTAILLLIISGNGISQDSKPPKTEDQTIVAAKESFSNFQLGIGLQQTISNRIFIEDSKLHYLGNALNIYYFYEKHPFNSKKWLYYSISDISYGKFSYPQVENIEYTDFSTQFENNFLYIIPSTKNSAITKMGVGLFFKTDASLFSEFNNQTETYYSISQNIQFGPSWFFESHQTRDLKVQAIAQFGLNNSLIYSDINSTYYEVFEEPWDNANSVVYSGFLNVVFNDSVSTSVHYRSIGFKETFSFILGYSF